MAPNLGSTLEKKNLTFENVFKFKNMDLENHDVKVIRKPKVKVMGLTCFIDDCDKAKNKGEESYFEF
jgi:hypothetical protein